MIFEEILLQIFLWTIALLSFGIAWEFYTSKNGRLRLLMIELFIAKIFVYGGAAFWYIAVDTHPPAIIRILLNAPMFFVMLKLWGYIRNAK